MSEPKILTINLVAWSVKSLFGVTSVTDFLACTGVSNWQPGVKVRATRGPTKHEKHSVLCLSLAIHCMYCWMCIGGVVVTSGGNKYSN